MKQSIQVSILGQQFNLKSDAPPEEVRRVAKFVEDQINQVTASGRAVDTLQAAILALLNVSAAHLEGKDLGADAVALDVERLESLAGRIEAVLD